MKHSLHSKTYRKFLVSYFGIMLIPCLVIFLCAQNIYHSICEKQMFSDYGEQLTQVEAKLDNVQNSIDIASESLRVYERKSGTHPNESILDRLEESKLFLYSMMYGNEYFSSIHLYSTDFPNVIYTVDGTYNVEYYKRYKTENTILTFDNFIHRSKGPQWIPESSIKWTHYENAIDYIKPINKTYTLIFSLDMRPLQKLCGNTSTLVILAPDKTLLYSNDNSLVSTGIYNAILSSLNQGKNCIHYNNKYILVRSSTQNSMICASILPEYLIDSQVQLIQNMLLICFCTILIFGAFIALWLAISQYKPIERIRNQVSTYRLVEPHFERAIDDFAVIDSSISRIQQNMHIQKLKKRNEILLMRVFDGQFIKKEQIEYVLEQIGFQIDDGFFLVFLVRFSQDFLHFDIMVDNILPDGCQFSSVEYVDNKEYVCLVMTSQREAFDAFVDNIRTEIQNKDISEKCFVISRTTEQILQIPLCYRQVINQTRKMNFPKSGLFYSDNEREDQDPLYPYLEIKSLYFSVSQWNTEKASLLLTSLVNLVENNRAKKFYAVSIISDTINIIFRATESLEKRQSDSIKEIIKNVKDDFSLENSIYVLHLLSDYLNNTTVEEKRDSLSERVIEYINNNVRDVNLNVSSIADYFGMSLSNLSHQFSRQTGIRISDYINEVQTDDIKSLLDTTNMSVNQIAEYYGFSQASSFIRKFKRVTGMTPIEYRALKKDDGSFDNPVNSEA
jgi:AraC-like DNA-binding protein